MALAASLASLGPGEDPEPDSCLFGDTGSISSIELGRGTFDDLDPFEPIDDGATVDIIQGGQGSSMYEVRYRLSGTEVPACVEHESILFTCATGSESCDTELARVDVPLRTYGDVQTSTTKSLFLILGGRVQDEFLLRANFGSLSGEWRVAVARDPDEPDEPDSGAAQERCDSLGSLCEGGCGSELECYQSRCLPPLFPPLCNLQSPCDAGDVCLERFDSQTGGYCVPSEDFDCICASAGSLYLGCAPQGFDAGP